MGGSSMNRRVPSIVGQSSTIHTRGNNDSSLSDQASSSQIRQEHIGGSYLRFIDWSRFHAVFEKHCSTRSGATDRSACPT